MPVIAAAIFITGVLNRMRIYLRFHVAYGQTDIYFVIHMVWGLVRIPLHFRVLYKRGETLSLVQLKNNGKRKLIYPKERKGKSLLQRLADNLKDSSYRDWLHLKQATLRLRTGTGNAAFTVLLCSFICNLFPIAAFVLFSDDNPKLYKQCKPDFARKVFILNLECIMYLNHVKIILVVLKNVLALKRKSA